MDRDAEGVGVYVDPWGRPYHLDALHVRPSPSGTEAVAVGRPVHRPDGSDVVSFGPDGLPGMDLAAGGFVEDASVDANGDGAPDAKDNVASW